MKDTIFILHFLCCFFIAPSSAQLEVEVAIQNLTVEGSIVEFDIMLKRTSSGTSNLYLGDAEFVLTFEASSFTDPVLIPSSIDNVNLIPANTSGDNSFITRVGYLNNTSIKAISDNELIINLRGPTPTTSTIGTRVAKIDGTPGLYKIGAFRLSGYKSGPINLQWKINGSMQRTRIFGFKLYAPFPQYEVNVTPHTSEALNFESKEIGFNNITSTNFASNASVFPSVANEQSVVREYLVMNIDPNPFNEIATLEFNLPKAGITSLEIYSFEGKMVKQFYEKTQLEKGKYVIELNGVYLPKGMMYLKLQVEDEIVIKKMVRVN